MIAASVQTFTAPLSMFFGQNWCAKCRVCGAVVTKYAESEADARSEAESMPHNCHAPYDRRAA